jgi:hypothetical protein
LQIAKYVESGEVVRITLDNLAIFFNRGWDFPHLEVFLSRS